ncbi:hypothetical protein [Phaeobacter gallaeciensis]|uniref:hypothetical protein n=1 Tax=Phaeobacter gallaeciensis TaxID=60890 RepID=UPI00237EEE6E|nr:hypothetical protein [Phaeobacter gallaeciensis]MDE4099101.1 hypothetical protein [Phaeobacter gallaeciensis]MDE4108033.1 hypothetical protein [Phaeobacter gallaeciensis]MDE4112365.1 hypothetical protein [Phaeobacter gallaeciensis]MDE4116958.1 hypothetical protein [Phaeobacter gallaeciensis]MDE4121307.1 hypothetical protein [Phaeobacter gallaeciensis]
MNIRFTISAIIFIGSYLPLSLILLAQDVNYNEVGGIFRLCQPQSLIDRVFKNPEFSLSIFAICVFCFFVSIIVLEMAKPRNPIQVTEAKYIPAELMNYTLPYVVSFMTFDYQETGKFIGLVIFLLWVFLITHRSGQVILNPLLIAFGWRHYELKYKFPGGGKDFSGHGLSRDKIEPNDRCLHSSLQDIMIVSVIEMKDEAK